MSSFEPLRVNVPDFMHDYENPHNPHASTSVRESMIELAMQDEYTLGDLLPLSIANGAVDTDELRDAVSKDGTDLEIEVEAITLRKDAHLSQDGQAESSAPPGGRTRAALKKASSLELGYCIIARVGTQNVIPLLLLLVGLLALKSGAPEDLWLTLRFLSVFPNKQLITRFAKDIATRLRANGLARTDTSWVLRFVVGDNCDYQTRNVHEHTDRSGEYVHTVNWLTVPILKYLLAGLPAS